MPETIKVVSARDDNRVVLTESHTLHPKEPGQEFGEAFVFSKDEPVEVGLTPLVMQKLRQGHIVEAKSTKATKAIDEDRSEYVKVEEAGATGDQVLGSGEPLDNFPDRGVAADVKKDREARAAKK